MASARCRNSMLCSFDPVKYTNAAPKLAGGTTSKST